MPKAKRAAAERVYVSIHTDEEKAEVKKARIVIARHKAVLGGGGVVVQQQMTLLHATAVMQRWRARIDTAKEEAAAAKEAKAAKKAAEAAKAAK